MCREEWVFIGPVCSGKSSVAEVLAQRLGVPHVELDALKDRYLGLDAEFDVGVFRAALTRSHTEAVHYVEPALVAMVERVFADCRDCVFDLGAGHTRHLDASHHQQVARALRPFRRVVLLLPSADPEESIRILRERSMSSRGTSWVHDDVDFIRHWVTSDQNSALATTTVVTGSSTPAQVADELLDRSMS